MLAPWALGALLAPSLLLFRLSHWLRKEERDYHCRDCGYEWVHKP